MKEVEKSIFLLLGPPMTKALDKSSIIIGEIKSKDVIQSTYSSVEMFKAMDNKNILPVDYRDTNVSMKVVKII